MCNLRDLWLPQRDRRYPVECGPLVGRMKGQESEGGDDKWVGGRALVILFQVLGLAGAAWHGLSSMGTALFYFIR